MAALQPAGGSQSPDDSMATWLLSAVTERNLPRLLLLLAHSTKEQINAQPAGSSSSPHTALHAACQLGDVVMTQLLVWVCFYFLLTLVHVSVIVCSETSKSFIDRNATGKNDD